LGLGSRRENDAVESRLEETGRPLSGCVSSLRASLSAFRGICLVGPLDDERDVGWGWGYSRLLVDRRY